MRLPLSYLALFIMGCQPTAPATTDSTSSGGSDTGSGMTGGPGMSSGATAPTTSGTTEPPATGSTSESMSGTTGGTTSGATSGTTAGTTTSSDTTTSDTTTTSDASSSSGQVEPGCPGGKPLFQSPELVVDQGLELCPDGLVHRHTAVECVHPTTFGEACKAPKTCNQPCDDFGDGLCTNYVQGCNCEYPCATDADCAADAACLCQGGLPLGGGQTHYYVGWTECVRAACHTDADCAPFLCGLSPGICGNGMVDGLFCHTPEDECLSTSDCGDGTQCGFEAAEKRWKCIALADCP